MYNKKTVQHTTVWFIQHFSQADYTLLNLNGHLRKYKNHIDLRFRIANFSLQWTVQGCTLQHLVKEDQTLLMQFRFLYVNLQQHFYISFIYCIFSFI
jgi:hypothetical protein